MNPKQVLQFTSGQIVLVRWPGAADGTNTKLARVSHVGPAGRRVYVHIARVKPSGELTGAWGSALRAYPPEDILSFLEASP